MRESQLQRDVVREIQRMFPQALVLKLDSSYLQGVPDRLILNGRNWAALEFKRSATAHVQPNQPYYVDLMDRMSFASFIYPENEHEVLDGIQRSLSSPR